MQMTVALLQMTACSDLAEPLTKGEAFCRRAHLMGADLALFPETWNVVSSLNSAGEDLRKAPERSLARDLLRSTNLILLPTNAGWIKP
jgi:predicted amidohydrolase